MGGGADKQRWYGSRCGGRCRGAERPTAEFGSLFRLLLRRRSVAAAAAWVGGCVGSTAATRRADGSRSRLHLRTRHIRPAVILQQEGSVTTGHGHALIRYAASGERLSHALLILSFQIVVPVLCPSCPPVLGYPMPLLAAFYDPRVPSRHARSQHGDGASLPRQRRQRRSLQRAGTSAWRA